MLMLRKGVLPPKRRTREPVQSALTASSPLPTLGLRSPLTLIVSDRVQCAAPSKVAIPTEEKGLTEMMLPDWSKPYAPDRSAALQGSGAAFNTGTILQNSALARIA